VIKRILLFTVFLFQVLNAVSQEAVDRELRGFWRGALIKGGNSVQLIEANIYERDDTLRIATEIPDWVYYPPRESPLNRNGDTIRFDTYYGEAQLLLDTNYIEMVGRIRDDSPSMNIHIKKNLKPYQRKLAQEEIAIKNRDADISGTLFYPLDMNTEQLACAVIVHGRGCSSRNNKESRARILAEYGIATFVYDKRGSQPSGFPCEESTHDLNVSDVKEIVKQVAEHPITNPLQIGLISYSAGGWIVPEVAVESQVPIAFMITVVGPTTSVLEQQLDGLEAFMIRDNASQEAIEEGKEYTRLLFADDNYPEVFVELQELLLKGEESGWTKWLVDDDYVEAPDAFDQLWVQRFQYDPAADLMSYPGPYLAIFGEDDFVVPYKKQLARLEKLMSESGKENYKVVVLPRAGHGLEHGSTPVQIDRNNYYFKFDRVAHGAIGQIVEFLEDEGFARK